MKRVEFDPANPTLFNIALTPENTSEFLSEEFFAQKLASFAASSEHPTHSGWGSMTV